MMPKLTGFAYRPLNEPAVKYCNYRGCDRGQDGGKAVVRYPDTYCCDGHKTKERLARMRDKRQKKSQA